MRCAGNIGIMFLNEVVLGKEHHITMDDYRLVAAPPGHDCIIAKGRTEPGELCDWCSNRTAQSSIWRCLAKLPWPPEMSTVVPELQSNNSNNDHNIGTY